MQTTRNCPGSLDRSRASTLDRLLEALRDWSSQQVLRARIQRERQQLREMPEAILRDLGITRGDAIAEARRNDIPPARRSAHRC